MYQSLKADAVEGRKPPELRNNKVVILAELIDEYGKISAVISRRFTERLA